MMVCRDFRFLPAFWRVSCIYPLIRPQDGFTSLAHPWSSGPTQWLSENIAGFSPDGDGSWRVQPHIARGMRGVAATQPLPGGAILSVGIKVKHEVGSSEGGGDEGDDAVVVVDNAKTVNVKLRISEVLAARMLR
jgi:hypothetical protein